MTPKKQGRFLKRVIALCMAAALLFTSVWYDTPQVYAKSSESLTGLDAQAIVKQIKIGWNLGNALDSVASKDNPTPQESVTAWGNPEPTEALIDRVKATGFNGIRIPVTWYQHLQFDEAKNEYVIDKDWMDYVQKVVDWAYDKDMFIILNIHHEEWVNAKVWTDETLADSSKKIHDIWTQIAERFKDYDQHLIFEAMNEPRQTGNPQVDEWGDGNQYSWDYINTLNKIFVDVVRGAGTQNAERLLMLPSYHAASSTKSLQALEIPEGSGNIALSVHAYTPYSFAMKTDEAHVYTDDAKDEWGNNLKADLKKMMDDLHTISKEKNLPVIIGEFGASDFGNQEERVKWAEDYLTQATNYGFSCFLWDNNAVYYEGDELSSEKYGCINRSNNLLYPNNEKVLKKMMEVVGVTDAEFDVQETAPFWKTFEIGSDWTVLKKFVSGVQIENYGGTELTSNLEYIKKGYRLAVAYEGSSAPSLICVEHKGENWNWLAGVRPAKDSTTNLAYYDYADIADVLEGHDMADIANLTAQTGEEAITVYGLFAIPYDIPDDPFWDTVSVKDNWIKIKKFAYGQQIANYDATSCGKEAMNYVDKDHRFAVLYDGAAAPQFVFVDKDWNYLNGIKPSQDSEEHIAYFDYEDMEAVLNGKTAADINDIRIQGQKEAISIYGIYAVPLNATDIEEKPSEGSEPTQPSEGSEPTKPSEGSEPTQPSEGSEPTQPSEGSKPDKPSGEKLTGQDAQAIVKQIKIGWNMGNTLDSTTEKTNPTPKDTATAWGNPEPTEALIDRVQKTGFNGIRIPVTWYQHLEFDESKNQYVIDKDWMDYVQQVVDWAYERDMFIILNLHHEDWVNEKIWSDDTLKIATQKMQDIWTQIAERFKDYDQHLIFEAMNEPRQTGNPDVAEWGNGNEYSLNYINTLNQTFVDVIRSSDSAANKERLLMIPTYDATNSIAALKPLKIPENGGNIALSVHAYSPYSFAMDASEKQHIYEPGAKDQWGNDLVASLKGTMDGLNQIAKEKNVPIILGEFGASDFGNPSERVKWAEDYLTQATNYGFPCFLWDNNVVHEEGDVLTGEKYGCINRADNKLYSNNIDVLKKMMEVVGVTDAEFVLSVPNTDPFWDTFQIPSDWITVKKFDTGEKIEDYGGSTLTGNLQYLKKGYRLAVVYEGTTLPKLICVDKNWNWLNGVCAAKDSTENIAYFDYVDVAEVLEGHELSEIANLTAQAQGAATTIYGIFAVPHEQEENSFWEKVLVPSDWVKLCRFPNGQTLASYKEANCGKTGFKYVSKDYRFAVLYEGEMAPQVVFIDKDWNYLDGILPAADSVENIAYYDYEDVIKTVADKTETDINDIRVQAQDKEATIYGLYAVPLTSSAPSVKPSEGSEASKPSDTSKPANPSEGSEPAQPSKGSEPSIPSKGSEPETPSKGSEPVSPSKGSEPETPSKGSEPETPSKGSEPTSPSKGSEPTSPSKGSEPTSPSKGSELDSPSKVSEPETPSKGSEPTSPSKESEPTSPSKGNEPTSPSKGNEPTSPSKGSEPTAPSSVSTPNVPSSVSEPASPSKGSEPTTPSKGNEPTSPSKGSEPSISSTVSTPQNPEPSQKPSGIAVQSITLAYENVTLKKGNKEQLQYAIQPTEAANQKLIWSSNKEEVAYVDSSGVVYGLAVGEATIMVKTEDGGKQASCKVTVTDTNTSITPSTPQITSLKPNKSSITLAVKKTFTIKVTIKPSGVTNKKLTYKSAKKSVATVSSSGVIKAVAPGKTTITIKSENGKKTTVNVKVVPAKVSGVSAKQPAKGQIKVTWKKQSGISQYQISYYDPKKGSYTKPKTVSKTSYTLKNCKKNATYKFKVRAIKKRDGTTYYGDYSSVVKIKAKK